jgi:hypothetical protein
LGNLKHKIINLKKVNMEHENLNNQESAQLGIGDVMPRLFAITAQEGWNEMFWDKDKAQHKIDTQYKKDFPNEEFWVEEIHVS